MNDYAVPAHGLVTVSEPVPRGMHGLFGAARFDQQRGMLRMCVGKLERQSNRFYGASRKVYVFCLLCLRYGFFLLPFLFILSCLL